MALVRYDRASTRDQHPEAQRHVSGRGCETAFTDQASDTLARAPRLDGALGYLRAGDTLAVTKLDRLGRSVRNLKQIIDDLEDRERRAAAAATGD